MHQNNKTRLGLLSLYCCKYFLLHYQTTTDKYQSKHMLYSFILSKVKIQFLTDLIQFGKLGLWLVQFSLFHLSNGAKYSPFLFKEIISTGFSICLNMGIISQGLLDPCGLSYLPSQWVSVGAQYIEEKKKRRRKKEDKNNDHLSFLVQMLVPRLLLNYVRSCYVVLQLVC